MAQVVVLLVGLEPAVLDLSDLPTEDWPDLRAAVREQIDRNLAWLRRLGYEVDFCGTATEQAAAADLLLKMMRAKRYNCIVFGADIRLSVPHTRLFERLLNLAGDEARHRHRLRHRLGRHRQNRSALVSLVRLGMSARSRRRSRPEALSEDPERRHGPLPVIALADIGAIR